MFKKVKVVMLPTNEKAKICLDYKKLTLYQNTLINCTQSWQHLYFLSDEEIDFKKDYAYHIDAVRNRHIIAPNTWVPNPLFCSKIIATTDKFLSKTIKSSYVQFGDNVEETKIEFLPQPSQSFIEKFVEDYNKGNVITEVMVEYEWNKTDKKIREVEIFDDVLKINPKDNTITIRKVKDSWNRAEQTDVIEKYLLMKEPDVYQRTKRSDIKKWIEQNL